MHAIFFLRGTRRLTTSLVLRSLAAHWADRRSVLYRDLAVALSVPLPQQVVARNNPRLFDGLMLPGLAEARL